MKFITLNNDCYDFEFSSNQSSNNEGTNTNTNNEFNSVLTTILDATINKKSSVERENDKMVEMAIDTYKILGCRLIKTIDPITN